ncbi:MAG: hypothetical protein SVC26_05590, partial [Pseudomonadota bacterium]|nr:hypothetical protein [Pseudomonadota bacterium]
MKSQAYGVMILGVACVLTGCSESQHPADNVSKKSIECLEPEQAKKGLAAMYTTERRFLSHDQGQEALSSDESFPVNLLRNAVFSVHELPMQAVTKVWKREPEERVSHIFAYDDRQYGVIYQTVNADSGLKGQEWSEVQNLLPMDAILAQLSLEQTTELAGCYTLQTYQGQIKGAQVTVSWLAELDLLYYYNESHHESSAHDHHPNEYETT